MERTQTIVLVSVAAVIVVIMAVLILVGGGSDSKSPQPVTGLSESPAPWPVETSGMAQRVRDLKLPLPGTEKYHVHARLVIYVDGKPQTVPANIGLGGGAASAMHTHDTSGIIHMEADAPFDAKLGDFFAVWGVKFSNTQLGAYKNDGDKTVQVYVNGKKIDDPVSYVMQKHDNIVVGYGAAGSFPTTVTEPFPEGV